MGYEESMGYEEFRRLVVAEAQALLEKGKHPKWRGSVSTDTIREAHLAGLPIAKAAADVVDDTLYWDGAFC